MSAADLRSLHVPGRPLVLPNVWDAATARLVADAGFPAVATSSSAVAESLGYADGEDAPVREMFAAVGRITRVVPLPVTVDAEAGYGLPADELVARLLDVGAAGCNLEDTDHADGGLVDTAKQADRLAAVRQAAGDALVVNARVDVFLSAADQRAVLDEAIERALAYLASGADCVYPILVRAPEVLRSFVDAVAAEGPVNALVLPDGPDVAALADLGVARVSLGPGLWHRTKTMLTRTLAEFASS